MGKCLLFQRRHTDGQQIYERVLNIINHQGNLNENHKEILPHICLDDLSGKYW
jgi:hypothetical protein